MEYAGIDPRLETVGRISVQHVATAVRKLRLMDVPQKMALIDEVHVKQPNLLASCLVQRQFGADDATIEFLLNLLLTCYLAMRESGFEWPPIGETEQERAFQRTMGAMRLSEGLTDAAAADAGRAQYVGAHPERPLLAFETRECNAWLKDLAQRKIEKESDKYVIMASIDWVNCIAHSDAHRRPEAPESTLPRKG
jgi:hypothetical protein